MFQINAGTLYMDGKAIEPLTNVTLTEYESDSGQDSIDISSLREPCEAIIEVKTKFDPKTLLLILTGMKVSNNWLKMHGGVMSRKRYSKKKRRTNK